MSVLWTTASFPMADADFVLPDGRVGYAYCGIAGWNVYVEGVCVVGDTTQGDALRWLNDLSAERIER